MRLSIINFAGIARTLVAVGTESEASIDATTRPATPRIGSIVDALGVTKTGAGLTCACAGVGAEGVTCATGAATAGAGATCAAGAACATGAGFACTADAAIAGAACAAGAGVACATGDGAEIFCAAFGTGGVPPFGADVAGADVAGADVAGADATVEVAAPGL